MSGNPCGFPDIGYLAGIGLSALSGSIGGAGSYDAMRNALAPAPPKRKDFGPNQLAWIEKNLGVKSLIARKP